MFASEKENSANQLHRTLGIILESAWFMAHRICEAMRFGELSYFGSDGGNVEVDETFIGYDRTIKPKGVYHHFATLYLYRYTAEFDFRYNHGGTIGIDDSDRADHALLGALGKRLKYRVPVTN